MPERVNDGHHWVGAATVSIPNTVVRQAFRRSIFRIPKDTKLQIAEVFCANCRKTYERAVGNTCEAIDSRDHLIGGPVGDQRKRRGAEEDQLHAAAG